MTRKDKHTSGTDTAPHAIGETDYSRFRPTAEIIKSPDNGKLKNLTAIKIQEGNDYAVITDFLRRNGIGRLSPKIPSRFALVSASNNHQMIRLVHRDAGLNFNITPDPLIGMLYHQCEDVSSDFNRLAHPLLVQPLMRLNISDEYALEVLPEVHTVDKVLESKELLDYYGISQDPSDWHGKALRKLTTDLGKCGLSLSIDKKKANFAVIKGADGPLLLVLDPGIVICNLVQPTEEAPAIRAYYEAAQQAHLKSLGLERGKLKGVLDKDGLKRALQEFADQRPHTAPSKALYTQALKAGVSPGELGVAAKNARKSDRGFCRAIRQEL